MKQILPLFLLSLLFIGSANSQPSITLRKSFIDSFKNRVTIDAHYNVWYSHKKPNPAIKDGDIHCSGYDAKIGLPMVAEIMNAKDHKDAMDLFIANEGHGDPNNQKLNLTGVWRIWPEHLGHEDFIQGMKLPIDQIEMKTTNPDHVFEIHPVTKLENFDLTSSLINIAGYEPKDVWSVFGQIKNKQFTINSGNKTISFSTKQIGNNYIDLWARVDQFWEVEDGAMAYCTILDSDFNPGTDKIADKLVTKKTRVVFVTGSEPYKQAAKKSGKHFIHILAIPRLDLALISWRAENSKKRPEVLNWGMPVEFIAAGVIEKKEEF